MMKKLLILWLFLPLVGNGQNLVLNPSFEDTIKMITSASDPIDSLIYDWKSPTNGGTPDYFHLLAPASTNRTIPNNSYGIQDTCDGMAYTGIFVYTDHTTFNYREYLTGKLGDSLIKNNCYKISFKYSLAEYSDYYISNLGVYLSNSIPIDNSASSGEKLNYTPQVVVNQWLKDRINWVKIERFYLAQGGERYFTMGNFKSNNNSNYAFIGNGTNNNTTKDCFIYIDDVHIEPVPTETLPQINLGADTILCKGEQITFDSLLPNNPVYVWNNLIESSDSSFTIDSTGLYWVEAYNGCAYTADTIFVEFVEPQPLGNDTVLCKEQGLFLNGYPHPEAQYLWSTGDTVSLIAANQEGLYWLETTIGSCTFSDSIEVKYHIPASAVLPTQNVDTSICLSGLLTATNTALWNEIYKWSTGENTENIVVSEDGIYNVEIKNECTEGNISYHVKIEREEEGYNPSNIFTPNGDGINDILLLYEGNSEMFELRIYNRWGKLIWQTQDPSQSWNGEGISDGVYHYELRFRNCAGDIIEKKGSVSVVK